MPGADPHLDALLDDLASISAAGAFRQEVLDAAGDRADLAAAGEQQPERPLGDEETEPTDTQATGEPVTVVFGFINANTAMTLTYDKVDYLEEPCKGLGRVDPGEIVAVVRTCFSNTNQRERTLKVSPDVIVFPYSAEAEIQPAGIAESSRFYGTQDDDLPPGAEFWKITLASGDVVVGLEQFPVGVL